MAAPTIDPLFLAFQEAVAGRYSLERELGRGGMGVVYLAREVRLDRQVAIKLLPPEFAAQETLRERFMREARTAARLSHPYIVPIHAVDEVGEFVFYVMAYVNGETLSERVRNRGPLPHADVTRIVREVAWALAYAHAQGVIHRDIKPANILLEAGTNRAMVTDFGIARLTNVKGETSAGEVLGTPEYMSPEQACGEPLDGRSDLYSLGIVAYYATTGDLPFSGGAREVLAQQITKQPPALASVTSSAPRALAAAVDRCLMKDATARFATGEELADALAVNLDVKAELPVPLRVFLDRRTQGAVLVPPVMGFMLAGPLLQVMASGGISPLGRLATAGGMALLFIGAPLALVLQRLRRVMKQGFVAEDVANAIRRKAEQRKEEFIYEYGPRHSFREKLLLGIGLVGATGVVGAVLAGAFAIGRPDVAGMTGLLSGYAAVLGLGISARWRRLRAGKEPFVAKLWRGGIGKALQRLAGYKLGARAMLQDRPTELGIVMNAEALFEELPKETRRAIGDVPAVLKSLETRARAMRERIATLDDSLAQAQRAIGSGRSTSSLVAGDMQTKLADDLKAARGAAESHLSEIVTAMETLRLNLLRLRAGAANMESVTQDLSAAQALSEDVDRLLAGAREVETALRKPSHRA